MFKSEDVPDDVLVSRLRSKMGRVVSHPRAIEITANQGRVTLRGQVLASEANDLISCISSASGVREVDNRLEVHEEVGNVPSLQGGDQRSGYSFELLQENWSPTARILVGTAGIASIVYCLSRRSTLGAAIGTLGFGLLTRSITNTDFKHLIGVANNGGTSKEVESTMIEIGEQPNDEVLGQNI